MMDIIREGRKRKPGYDGYNQKREEGKTRV